MWHFIDQKPEPRFLETPPGQSMPVCFCPGERWMRLSSSGEAQPFVAWQAASATPAKSCRPPRAPAAQRGEAPWPVATSVPGNPGSLGLTWVAEARGWGAPWQNLPLSSPHCASNQEAKRDPRLANI